MTHKILTLGNLTLAAMAVAFAAVSIADDTKAHDKSKPLALPISCEFALSEGRFGQIYQGIITANEDVRGTYRMKFTTNGRNSSNIRQAGNINLVAGETTMLGQVSFGDATHVDIELTLKLNGQKMTCTNQPIDL